MNRFFYLRLAVNNIKKNFRAYFPFMLTCIGTIIMFYNMCFVTVTKDIGSFSNSRSLRTILCLGAVVIAIFSVIFLFYTNSFLIKQRKKEFGLFNILGMEKKHICRIIFLETLIVAVISIVSGLLGGILLSKLIILLLFRLISFPAKFGFDIPAGAVGITLVLFCGIFLVNLIFNIFQVRLSKPVELLRGGNVGEKVPKTNWILSITGILCLGLGYYMALTVKSPIAALNEFFAAVILVIIGTYCLFIAGSIAILKMLRSNKKYYYKAEHFISVSGMIYRMKQNAAGLANICILSTMIIVMLSTTISMYVGMEDLLRNRYPRNIDVSASNVTDTQAKKLDDIIKGQAAKAGIAPKNVVRFRSMDYIAIQNKASFTGADSKSYSMSKSAYIFFIPLDDYNSMEKKSESLSKGEALLYVCRGDISGSTLDFNGLKFSVKKRLSSFNSKGIMSAIAAKCYYVVVDSADTIKQVNSTLAQTKDGSNELSYYYGFDVDSSKESQISLVNSLQSALNSTGIKGYAEGAESSRDSFYSIYGSLLFIGLFLGLLFVMAAVLIIYYKQVAEGYDDRERFEIMQKVGLSHAEVKKSIHSQVLAVFFLPLIVAVIHLSFAFKMITKLLATLNLTNVPLFATFTVITIVVFALFYAAIYSLTARTYYRIVS